MGEKVNPGDYVSMVWADSNPDASGKNVTPHVFRVKDVDGSGVVTLTRPPEDFEYTCRIEHIRLATDDQKREAGIT